MQSLKPSLKVRAQAELERRRRQKSQNSLINREQLESDYRKWLTTLLPKHFRNPEVGKQFAPHHRQFFDWGWDWEPHRVDENGSIVPPACLWIVNRGGNKSTSAAGLAVGLGARKKRKYGLVITRTETQGDTHVRRVNSMLLSSAVGQVYPGMAEPQVKEVGTRKQTAAWNRTQLTTADGWTLQSFSLLASLRGVGLEEYRPDFIWITDIDDEHDSVGMVKTLLNALSSSVLATMASDCMVVFDQNLIHRGSALNQIYTRQTDVLSERVTVGPVPALYDVDEHSYKREHERWKIVSGRPSWPGGMSRDECESKLNLWGKDTWEREAQHNINLPYEDAVYGMFDPVYHVITWDEFAQFYSAHDKFGEWKVFTGDGKPRLPAPGYKSMAQDWGNNPKHPCANRWLWWPGQRMPLTDSLFFYREMCWPRFPKVDGDDRVGPSPLQVAKAIHRAETPWEEKKNMLHRMASHERPEIVRAYERDLSEANVEPLEFEQINTSEAREGILHMQNFLTIIKDEAHPFRIDPRTLETVPSHLCRICKRTHAGFHLQGRPRGYFIVANGQGELYTDAMGQLAVKPAIDELGMARTRDEYPNYRKPDTSEGAEKKDAPKLRDDVIDCDRALVGRVGPQIEPLTAEQRAFLWVENRLPLSAIEQMSADVRVYGQMSRDHHIQERIEEERKQDQSWFEKLEGWSES
jgi:hypothetical protein